MQKGKKFFNIIISITAIALISVIIYIAYYYISNYIALKEAEKAVEEFENKVIVVAIEDEENIGNEVQTQQTPQVPQTSTSSNKASKVSYKGYSMIGTIQIPKTKIKAPIVDKVTTSSITSAAAVLYGP